MQLIRRTAWMNLQILDRGPSEADARYVPAAVKMLTLVACMGYAVLDLEEALAEAGKLRHIVKQRMNQIRRLTEYAHGTAFNMLRTVNPMAARQYNDQLDWMYGRISDCVLLPEPEKSYNVVVALAGSLRSTTGKYPDDMILLRRSRCTKYHRCSNVRGSLTTSWMILSK